MIIRITRNSEGIEYYLETGQKRGRNLSRDELDRRVHLSGDLTAFSQAVTYSKKHKKWKNNYIHISASFSIEDNHLTDETLRDITDDLLSYYFCDYKKETLIFACEAHRPIIQSEINKSTGKNLQRLLHLHLAVSMLDVTTGNQVRMIPFKLEADKAFQSSIAKKYNLVDPNNKKRKIIYTKKDIITRWNNNQEIIHKQTKVADLRKLFAEILIDIKDIEEAKTRLNNLDIVASVEFKEQKSGNKYLQVKTTLGTKNINLRGKGFEPIEALYYNDKLLKKRIDEGKYKDISKRSDKEIIEEHKSWWLEQQAKRKPKKINHKKTEQKYENKYKNRIKESRIYYILYQNNIQEELITGYRIWEKNNIKYLFNNALGVKIYDQPNKITANIPDNEETRSQTVRLMLEMAVAKGWNLKTLHISGSSNFKHEVEKQIKVVLNSEKVEHIVRQAPPKKLHKSPLNTVKQSIVESKEKRLKKHISKELIASIKTELDANMVMNYAIKKYRLIAEHFHVIDNKIKDDRNKAKAKNNIDFLTKNCNITFSEALPLLNQLLQIQRQRQKEEQKHIIKKAKETIKNQITPRIVNEFNTDTFYKCINMDAINQLPLNTIYETYTEQKLQQEGCYLMGKGITPDTSSKKHSFTIMQEENEWIWHDFKTGESGNVLTFMHYVTGMNAYSATQALEKKFNLTLLVDNPAFYASKINEALRDETVQNNQMLEEALSLSVNVTFVKIEENTVKFADKEFSFAELGIDKTDMLNHLQDNRKNNRKNNYRSLR